MTVSIFMTQLIAKPFIMVYGIITLLKFSCKKVWSLYSITGLITLITYNKNNWTLKYNKSAHKNKSKIKPLLIQWININNEL